MKAPFPTPVRIKSGHNWTAYSVRGQPICIDDEGAEFIEAAINSHEALMEIATDFWAMRAANIVGMEHPTINLDSIALKVREVLYRDRWNNDDRPVGPRTKMQRKEKER